jgi:hypothetical protein
MAAPPWTNALDEAKPADNDLASSLGTQGRQAKLDIRQRMAYQHIWNVDTTRDGAHINMILDDVGTLPNKEILRAGGYSLTGSDAHAMVELSGEWNTTGIPTQCRYNINDTASNAAALLVDRQVGGVSKYKIDKAGNATFAGTVKGGQNVVIDTSNTQLLLATSYQTISGISVTITPSSTSRRIRLTASINLWLEFQAVAYGQIDLRFERGGAQILEYAAALIGQKEATSGTSQINGGNVYIEMIDSPASVATLTYTIGAKFSGSPFSARVNPIGGGTVSSLTAMEV